MSVASVFLLIFLSSDALAHAKWFSAYDLTIPPRSVYFVFTNFYVVLFCAMLLPVIGFAGYADNYLVSNNIQLKTLLIRSNAWIEPQFFRVMQVSIFAFFISIFWYGDILLTPELNIVASDRKWVEVLQIAIAVAVVSRHTAFLSGIGIAVLYAIAAHRYGMFHLLDYPIFLGVAAYIFIISLFGTSYAALARNILRIFTGITLMWAGIEKLAYPEWSFPILQSHPGISFGLDSELYMAAAGFIEFAAAFFLLTGALASRMAAAVLLIFLVSAVPIFGLIDAIGHALFIAVLILLIFSHNQTSIPALLPHKTHAQHAVLNAILFYVALLLMTAFFYGGHRLYYGK
ncbi:MAG: hypothetical protein A3I66_13120 [Burkholderiales bacterium RIFCSPLOWO2_02_FULL_57_36]|nr:MAG: hypothetical protein A3I66_13120 [Burkholderiales bacterium RIFCSPLOWO2_02_FULL_57_36]